MSFGNRKLEDESDVFDNNAWDDYEWTEEMEREAQALIDEAAKEPMTEEQKEKYISNAAEFWNDFYGNHESKFFKNRKWLTREFPELLQECLCSGPCTNGPAEFAGKSASLRVLEVGCGAGNSVTPILEDRWRCIDSVFVYACDFSKEAVSIVQNSHLYKPEQCLAFTQDISKPNLTWPFPPASIDAICMIFVLSAIYPDNFIQTIRNLYACLRPGGILFFRDYGRYDMAQIRFKKGRCIENNFYTRGDGTCVYFFKQEEIGQLFNAEGFVELENKLDRRLLVNRRKQLKMYRVWIQGKYRKPLTKSD